MVNKDCNLKNLKKIGPILVFETLQSEISLQELHEQIQIHTSLESHWQYASDGV